MKLFLGNYNAQLNCDELLKQVKSTDVEYFYSHMNLTEEEQKSTDELRKLGYNEHNVKFKHYSFGKHFDKWFAEELGRITNVTPVMCVVSSIEPGCMVPWHVDYNPWENEHKQHGELHRFLCFIDKPQNGHVFMVEDESFYYEEQGNVYKYPSIHSYHAGANAGLTTKYLLTMTGYSV